MGLIHYLPYEPALASVKYYQVWRLFRGMRCRKPKWALMLWRKVALFGTGVQGTKLGHIGRGRPEGGNEIGQGGHTLLFGTSVFIPNLVTV